MVLLNGLKIAAVCLVLGVSHTVAQAELPVETISIQNLPPADPYRLYLSDFVVSHFVDGKLMIIDGKTLKVQGHVAQGLAGHSTVSPDRKEIFVGATYFSKLNRGDKIAQLDVYDAQTLKLKAEISLPPKLAQSFSYRGAIRASADGRYVFLQNATPATSVSVVDRVAGKFVGEVPTPGCWMIYPAESNSSRFSTMCGDGTMMTVTLDQDGKVIGKKKSRKFFDPDADALFVSGEQRGDDYTFVSFKGQVQSVNVGGDEALPAAPWSLVSDAGQKSGWRPGGYQPLTIHHQSGRLYVAMHPKGKEGSHKAGAKEIWAYDLAKKKKVGRVPAHHATIVAVTQGNAPRLYGYSTEKSTISMYDVDGKLKHLRTEGPFAELGTQLDPQ